MVTGVENNVLTAPIAISLAPLVIVVINYMDATPPPPRTTHMSQSSDSQPPQLPSSSTSQGILPMDNEYEDYLCYQAAKSASIAETGNVSTCLIHTSSLGPWILDSGASDHISSNKNLFSSITITFALPIVTLANGSQTVDKGIGLAHPPFPITHFCSLYS